MRSTILTALAVLSCPLLCDATLGGVSRGGTASAPAAARPVQAARDARAAAIAISFRLLAEGGEPVLDLAPEEIRLAVDGRAQQVQSVHLVDAGGAAAASSPIAPPFATNVAAVGGRDILLLLDDESIAPGREESFKTAVQNLLAGLSREDRVRFETVRETVRRPSTTQHDSVMATVTSTRGRAPAAETPEDISCRTRVALQAIETSFRNVRGPAPATIVFFSTSLLPPSEASALMGAASDLCEVRLEHFNKVVALARSTPADFYVVDLADGVPAGSTLEMEAGLQSLAGSTGGDFIRVSANNVGAIAQVARETSAFYRAVFEPSGLDDRATHRVELKVDRRNVRVRTQQEVAIPNAVSRGAEAERAPAPGDMLGMARTFRDLQLRATAYSSQNEGDDRIKVTVVFEPADGTARLEAAVVGLFDEKGKLAAKWSARSGELARAPAMAALTASPGAYRLRLVARDERGRGATVDDELWVGLGGAGPVKWSGLALGVSQGTSLAPALLFRAQEAAVGYMEIYGVPSTALVAVTLEVAPADTRPAVVTVPATVRPASDAAGARVVIGAIPISSLPPGDYLVRALVSVDGTPIGRAVRTLRKELR